MGEINSRLGKIKIGEGVAVIEEKDSGEKERE